MQRIENPGMQDSASVQWRRIGWLCCIQTKKHAQGSILRPILEHVMSNFVGGCFQPGLQGFELLDRTDLFEASAHQIQKSEKYVLSRRELIGIEEFALEQILECNGPTHQVIVAEIEESGQPEGTDRCFPRVGITKAMDFTERPVFSFGNRGRDQPRLEIFLERCYSRMSACALGFFRKESCRINQIVDNFDFINRYSPNGSLLVIPLAYLNFPRGHGAGAYHLLNTSYLGIIEFPCSGN